MPWPPHFVTLHRELWQAAGGTGAIPPLPPPPPEMNLASSTDARWGHVFVKLLGTLYDIQPQRSATPGEGVAPQPATIPAPDSKPEAEQKRAASYAVVDEITRRRQATREIRRGTTGAPESTSINPAPLESPPFEPSAHEPAATDLSSVWAPLTPASPEEAAPKTTGTEAGAPVEEYGGTGVLELPPPQTPAPALASPADTAPAESPPLPAEAPDEAPDDAPASADTQAASLAASLMAALTAVPDPWRPARWARELSGALEAQPGILLTDVTILETLIADLAMLAGPARVVPALRRALDDVLAALAPLPGVLMPALGAPPDAALSLAAERIPSATPPGTIVRVCAPGLSRPGRAAIPARVLASGTEVSVARAALEVLPVAHALIRREVADAPEEALSFLRRAPSLIDTHAGGNPLAGDGLSLLRDCVRFTVRLGYLFCPPERPRAASLLDGVFQAVTALLESVGERVYPGAAAPYTPGQPAPAPFPPASHMSVPDPAPAGTLLRVRRAGVLIDGKVAIEPRIAVSAGPTPTDLARALNQIAAGVRGVPRPLEVWAAAADRVDELIGQYVAAGPDDADRARALRFLVNHADEVLALPQSRDAAGTGMLKLGADGLTRYLGQHFGMREITASVGRVADARFDAKRYDFERRTGVDAPPKTILAVKRRGFIGRDGLPLQKAVLIIA